MDEYVILGHYSKREHVEDYFNYVKNELGLGAPVYLANKYAHACRGCTDMLYCVDGISILAKFQRPNRIKRIC
jgi:hypothetical protein